MFNFIKKDTEFFDLFLENAKFFHLGAVILYEVIKDPSKSSNRINEILNLESAADEVNEKIITKLNKSFITPLDREDIYNIANELDIGVDMLQGALQRIVMYHAGHSTKGSLNFTKILIESTHELVNTFISLYDVKKNQTKILDAIRKISSYESKGDLIFRAEIGILFDNAEFNGKEKDTSHEIIHLIKWKDILEDVENALDHCKKVSDMIHGVVIKYA